MSNKTNQRAIFNGWLTKYPAEHFTDDDIAVMWEAWQAGFSTGLELSAEHCNRVFRQTYPMPSSTVAEACMEAINGMKDK